MRCVREKSPENGATDVFAASAAARLAVEASSAPTTRARRAKHLAEPSGAMDYRNSLRGCESAVGSGKCAVRAAPRTLAGWRCVIAPASLVRDQLGPDVARAVTAVDDVDAAAGGWYLKLGDVGFWLAADDGARGRRHPAKVVRLEPRARARDMPRVRVSAFIEGGRPNPIPTPTPTPTNCVGPSEAHSDAFSDACRLGLFFVILTLNPNSVRLQARVRVRVWVRVRVRAIANPNLEP